jgi:hypothetical protein
MFNGIAAITADRRHWHCIQPGRRIGMRKERHVMAAMLEVLGNIVGKCLQATCEGLADRVFDVREDSDLQTGWVHNGLELALRASLRS